MRSEAIARAFQLQVRLSRTTQRPFSLVSFVQIPLEAKSRAFTNLSRKQGFSTSNAVHSVQVTNPRQDDDGKEKLIDITSRAAKRLSEIMVKDKNPDIALRITVESGGCHGFQYLMALSNARDISAEDDILFEADDGSGAKVIMDEPSLDLLQGSKVDYTTELIGSQFKIVGNPKASSSCGCGTSFDIKM